VNDPSAAGNPMETETTAATATGTESQDADGVVRSYNVKSKQSQIYPIHKHVDRFYFLSYGCS